MTAQLQQAIGAIVNEIVTRYQPEKIILFGSLAHGDGSEESDVDLCVIKTRVPRYGRDRYREITDAVDTPVPCDFLIYTPKEIQYRLSLGDPFIKQIMEEGRVLYG